MTVVDLIIDRDFIVNRHFFFDCSLATKRRDGHARRAALVEARAGGRAAVSLLSDGRRRYTVTRRPLSVLKVGVKLWILLQQQQRQAECFIA